MPEENVVDMKQLQTIESDGDFCSLVGNSEQMRKVYKLIDKAARVRSNVLITGESGTGKELAARAIWQRSARSNKVFHALNCAAVAETLLESELFGHERGSFTGAIKENLGAFRAAEKGTLFLDEIAEASPAMQTKLLSTLEEQEVKPVGGTRAVKIDVRLVSASSQHRLPELRMELYYRLNVIHIALPPLRERGDDVEVIARHFVRKFSQDCERSEPQLTANAVEQLRSNRWSGNVRQLKAVVESAVALCDGDEIGGCDLEHIIAKSVYPGSAQKSGALVEPVTQAPQANVQSESQGGLVTLAELERQHIERVLTSVDGNKVRAAEILGISRKTLHNKLQSKDAAPADQPGQ